MQISERNKFLLYIDILGFSEMVKGDHFQIRRVYRIIENLNAHEHYAFKVIVFSDTILIYNKVEPISNHDREYLVMYLIEFAQNLLYEFAGKKLFFRGVLVHGEFEHVITEKFERYFGTALVDAYQKNKTIDCCGLFIDNYCQKYNKFFPVERYNTDVVFVYLNQSLNGFTPFDLGTWPVDPQLLYQLDAQWHLAKDVYFLRDMYFEMKQHTDERVRKKMLNTWNFYYKRYGKLLNDLRNKNFDLSVISNGFDWRKAVARMKDGVKGFGSKIPSIEEFIAIFEEAQKQGKLAAEKKIKEMYGDRDPQKVFYPCGMCSIVLDIDGRSELARFLIGSGKKIKDFSFQKTHKQGYMFSIRNMHSCQAKEVDVVASEAALEVLKKELDVEGTVVAYDD